MIRTVCCVPFVLALTVPTDASEIGSDHFRVGLNEFGVITKRPEAGLQHVDGPLLTVGAGSGEWYGVSFRTGGATFAAVAPGSEPAWDERPVVTPVSFSAGAATAVAVVRHEAIEMESFMRFDATGTLLHVTVTLTNRGAAPVTDLYYSREWRVPPTTGWTFPRDLPDLTKAPDDVARQLWMLDNLLPGASASLTLSYRDAGAGPSGGASAGDGVDVPLSLWTSGSWPSGLPVGDTFGIVFGDYDADGWIDIFALQSANLWRNLGGTDWVLAANLDDKLPPTEFRYSISFGDYNNDGLLDMATESRNCCAGDQCCHILKNLGDSVFLNVAVDPTIVDTPLCNADAETNCWGDVDCDGDLDLFIPVYPPTIGDNSGNFFLENLGESGGEYRFAERVDEVGLDNPPGAARPEGAQFVDVDFDGDMDLYSNGTLYQNVSSLGSPLFNPMTENGSGIGLSTQLDEGAALFDYDLDGDYDLAIVYTGPGVKIWEARGDGTYFAAGDIIDSAFTGLNLGLSAEDWDNDGDIDFTTRQVFRRNMFMETGGDRHFTVASTSIPAGHITSATPAWGDWDRDGDLDCALGNWFDVGHFYENTLYDGSTPMDDRRYVRVRTLRDSETVPAGLETEYATSVELVVAGDPASMRRKKFVASGHGYLNQNEYTLHFALPADPAPGDPGEDVHFDAIIDFPNLPAEGFRRVDKHVNSALGDVNLADLAEREIIVFRSGRVLIDGEEHLPDGDPALLVTAAGGLALPDPSGGLDDPSGAGGNGAWVGVDLDTGDATTPLRVREVIVDGIIRPGTSCDGTPRNLALWDVTNPVEPVVVAGMELPASNRNHRLGVPTNILLQPDRHYRLVASVDALRGSPIAGPTSEGGLTVAGGLLIIDLDPCSGQNVVTAPVDPSQIFATVRFGPVGDVPGDVDGDGSVGFTDLLALLAAWGPCLPPPDPCPADFDGNGVVDFVDLLVVLSGWTG
ncbi:MAG: VCBS repeat-containing protein [Phycisphaerae bacterium]|nr:VCBS repeat-containing protein [Phycisphaerae bacterium]NNF41958.1 VCBS repeat-containing protein [Phycisphaerales bacterium]